MPVTAGCTSPMPVAVAVGLIEKGLRKHFGSFGNAVLGP